ncbi:MAG: bifunctional DNA-formamidopyrimidine glycosylase/DNA-(apurinic or apyrimidinic site) lyase [Methylococcales bacterium]|nr:bifunctional DNA-formamidopyrimidine glycosylase/DNA-(apurinic or apyrimidinic site) lyase [Methylococcales bacterium]
MPELPEVETVCNGIRPHIQAKIITQVIVRDPQLRWRIPDDFIEMVMGITVNKITRRGKYCLLEADDGSVILHLGMSGSLHIVAENHPIKAHDHVDFIFEDQIILRFNDPRKFGAVLWAEGDVFEHRLLKNLGPEPLSVDFTGELLFQRALKRRKAVKNFIMDGHIVVGVGNIYASESLFAAGIHPERAAGQISLAEYQTLAQAIRNVLEKAITQGGTTLKDFTNADGKPGYFSQALQVYARAGELCYQCQTPISKITLGQRASYFCHQCQH